MNTELSISNAEPRPAASCWLFHKWSGWVEFQKPIILEMAGAAHKGFAPAQKRICLRCGKVEVASL